MQTVETLNEGLKRAYTLTITAEDIDARVDAEVKRVAPQVRMPGFRPGKVPANLVRKMHGAALAQDALNNSIQEGVQQLITEQQLRPAMQPSVSLAEGDYTPGQDAAVTVELEVLPEVPTPSIDSLTLERLTVPVTDEMIETQLRRFAEQARRFDDGPDGHEAARGDQVVMDFAGQVNGVAFEGGTGEDMAVEIGSGRLIPGFEDQLVGVKAGDEKQIHVSFPADYGSKELAGKDATFDLVIKAVQIAAETQIDDAMAQQFGLTDLEQFKGLVRGQIEQELNGLTRTYMKRKLLDQLAAGHDFPVPPSMVEAEFRQIWAQLEHEATHEADPAAAMAEMEKERDDYRAIAERRVRLGLLLSEIGQANGVEVSQQEMNRLVAEAAQQYGPEDRQRFVQYIQQEPMAAAQLRAPLYEDKVVDLLFGKAEITDRETSREELEAAIESDDGFATGTHVHSHDHDHEDHDHDHDHDHSDNEHGHHQGHQHDSAGAEAPNADEAAQPAEPVKKTTRKKAPTADAGVPEASASEDAVAAEPVKKAATRKAPKTDAGEGAEAAPKKRAASKKSSVEEA